MVFSGSRPKPDCPSRMRVFPIQERVKPLACHDFRIQDESVDNLTLRARAISLPWYSALSIHGRLRLGRTVCVHSGRPFGATRTTLEFSALARPTFYRLGGIGRPAAVELWH